MQHLLKNPRPYSMPKILDLNDSMSGKTGWIPTEYVAVIKGSAEECNIPEILASFVEMDKTYTIGGKPFSGKTLITLAEAYRDKHFKGKKFRSVCQGGHRIIAAFLAIAINGANIVPLVAEVTEEVANQLALSGNSAHDLINRMANSDRLEEVVRLMRTNVYRAEGDLPFKRGLRQRFWSQGQLVIIHEIPMEKALELDKEQARNATNVDKNPGKTVEQAVDGYIAGKAGNAKKVLSGEKLRDLLKAAKRNDPEATTPVTKLLIAITEALETDANVIVQKATTA